MTVVVLDQAGFPLSVTVCDRCGCLLDGIEFYTLYKPCGDYLSGVVLHYCKDCYFLRDE